MVTVLALDHKIEVIFEHFAYIYAGEGQLTKMAAHYLNNLLLAPYFSHLAPDFIVTVSHFVKYVFMHC